MAIGALLYAILAIIAVASRGAPQGNDIVLLVTAAYSLSTVVLLMVLRGRTPLWLMQANVVLVVGITGVLVANSPTAVGAANVSFRYLAIPIYVAFWMTWRMTLLTAALITVTSLIAYGVREDDASQLLLTWMLVSVLTWFLGVVVNYLSRAAARSATVDPLTGMLNRSALATLIELSQVPGRVVLPRTVVVIDIDDFKQINDTQGHLAGDRALTRLGDAWRRTLRADDIAVRSGGDEFLLILPKTNISEAEALVIRLKADSPVPWSYGIADWPAHEDFDISIAHADAELYKQKRARPIEPIVGQEARRDGST
jgi:diguanylate cyclase (GGDEF)-like protein